MDEMTKAPAAEPAEDVGEMADLASRHDEADAIAADEGLPSGTWRVENVEDLDYALRRIGEWERVQRENSAIVEAQIARLRARLEEINAAPERNRAFFASRAEEYARNNRAALLVGKAKTRKLPSGEVQFRAKAGRLVVEDAEKLLEWTRGQPAEFGLVRSKPEPALAKIADFCAPRTGPDGNPLGQIIPPGMKWEEDSETITIKPAQTALATK